MYLQTGFGQVPPSPCREDVNLQSRVDFAFASDHLVKRLDEFDFGKRDLRTWHRTWIKRNFAPAIILSWNTNKPIRAIILIGHADEVGGQVENYELGLARALAVFYEMKTQIERQSPGLSSKITFEIYSAGKCRPLPSETKREKLNRLVNVFMVRGAASPTPSATPTSPTTP
jgi:hypothetical protein